MKIEIQGKQRFRGVSKKTGNPYDFITIYYLSPARFVEGLAAKTTTIDPSMYPYEDIGIGELYNIEFDNNAYVIDFSPA